MKKICFLFIILSFTRLLGYAQTYVTLQKGQTYSSLAIKYDLNIGQFEELGPHLALRLPINSWNYASTIYAVSRGTGYAISSNGMPYIFTVVDVVNIDLPEKVEVRLGEQFSYSPIITDAEAETTLSWTSSNSAVASVDATGVVTTASIGQATITCTATNGVKAQSLITVIPMLVQSVTLNIKKCEINVGESLQLKSVILPTNVTVSDVKWLSSNDNIAQVDDEGNVTAIGSGYCSIYVKANDGSGQFDKCLVHVLDTSKKGDVNGDGNVNLSDAKMVVDIFVGKES